LVHGSAEPGRVAKADEFLAEPGHWKANVFKQMLFGPFGTTLPHFSIIFVHHKYVITIFHSLASPMLMHTMPMHISRHHGDTISPRTWYYYSAILAMINREYLSIDHYPIMTDAGAVTS